MIKVVKKDGSKEEFNVQKIIVAVNKSAYRALIKFTEEELEAISSEDQMEILNRLNIIAMSHHITQIITMI